MKFTIKETNKTVFKINNFKNKNCLIHTNRGNFFRIRTGGSFYVYTSSFSCYGGFNISLDTSNQRFVKELEQFLKQHINNEVKVLNIVSLDNVEINIKARKEVV